ncbi:alpha/beta fold hydrolase [Pradoshia sp.]|uniref:alpha/beta fold hydrolase n=1 Tax=Pradoshia sp. TaxID=2651281 RepID=UPI003F029C17
MEEGRFIEIRGKQLYVEISGERQKNVILYLHGGPGEGCFDFTYHQLERFGNDFCVVAFDQRGTLRSEEIDVHEPFGLDDLIEDCEGLRCFFGIDKWSVIGHSFGGYLALLYASRYPDSIEKVVFEGPTFDFRLTAKSLLKKTAGLCAEYELFDVQERCLSLIRNSSIRTRELVEGYMEEREYLGDNRMRVYTYNFADLADTSVYTDAEWDLFYERSEVHYNRLRDEGRIFKNVLPLLKELSMPCLLIMGEHDAVPCPIQMDAFQIDVRLGETYIVRECGHTPHYEAADEFYKVVCGFLKGERKDE